MSSDDTTDRYRERISVLEYETEELREKVRKLERDLQFFEDLFYELKGEFESHVSRE